jgi:hypothetical protein
MGCLEKSRLYPKHYFDKFMVTKGYLCFIALGVLLAKRAGSFFANSGRYWPDA